MIQYAEYCGWASARAHVRAGQPALIAGNLGKGDQFDEAVADFATVYAQQNERDYKAMVQAARQGRIEVYTEVIPWPQRPGLFSGRFTKGQVARLIF